ncbi:hypothetical protein LOK49_LG03G03913 [Camellia lanceoleosa]|uniref:Uncharacterized protein n=1 Tax=Camellia lanceoleosa TaxID=1840588 RepID=A0ACC0I5S4_9ERIC|nr:hypothetical protein LOK49_LG03G03913 [Camellia lanceoleosa]
MNDVHHRVRNQSLYQKHNLIRNRVLCIFRFQIRNRFRYMLIFIFIFIIRFCIRSYVVHPLANRSDWSRDYRQSWYQRPGGSITCAQVAMVLFPPGKGQIQITTVLFSPGKGQIHGIISPE